MITLLAIALLIIVGGLFVMMAVTPMVAETERRKAPAPQSLGSPARRIGRCPSLDGGIIISTRHSPGYLKFTLEGLDLDMKGRCGFDPAR